MNRKDRNSVIRGFFFGMAAVAVFTIAQGPDVIAGKKATAKPTDVANVDGANVKVSFTEVKGKDGKAVKAVKVVATNPGSKAVNVTPNLVLKELSKPMLMSRSAPMSLRRNLKVLDLKVAAGKSKKVVLPLNGIAADKIVTAALVDKSNRVRAKAETTTVETK